MKYSLANVLYLGKIYEQIHKYLKGELDYKVEITFKFNFEYMLPALYFHKKYRVYNKFILTSFIYVTGSTILY